MPSSSDEDAAKQTQAPKPPKQLQPSVMIAFDDDENSVSDEQSADPGLAYLQAIEDVARAPAPVSAPALHHRRRRRRLTEEQKKARRREAQKRIVREQRMRMRLKQEAYNAAVREREAEAAEHEAWQQKQRENEVRLARREANDGDEGDAAGGGLHPACVGLKLRDPAKYMRFYPAFQHPAYFGYKRERATVAELAGGAATSSSAAMAHRRAHPLDTGGMLFVRCEGWSGVRLTKPALAEAAQATAGEEGGVGQYAAVRLGDELREGNRYLNDDAADRTSVDFEDMAEFMEDRDGGWLTWEVGHEQDRHPHKMTVMLYSGSTRVGEADVAWVAALARLVDEQIVAAKARAEARALAQRERGMGVGGELRAGTDGAESGDSESEEGGQESARGVLVDVSLRNRHGRKSGTVQLRIRYERRSHVPVTDLPSLKDTDMLAGRAMVFGVPDAGAEGWTPADDAEDAARWRKEQRSRWAADAVRGSAFVGGDAGSDENGSEAGAGDGSGSGSDDSFAAEERVERAKAERARAVREAAKARTSGGAQKSAFAVAGAAHATCLSEADARRYNSGMMVHPAVWGRKLTPLVSREAAMITPVFFDRYLKLGEDAELDLLGPLEQIAAEATGEALANFKPRPGKPAGDCPVCFTSDVPGCPCCWNFPDPTPAMRRVLASSKGAERQRGGDKEPKYEFGFDIDDPDVTASQLQAFLSDAQWRIVRSEQMKDMHTKLKTRGAVMEQRHLHSSTVRFLVKGLLPPGPVVSFSLDKADTVGYLYQQYCANAGPILQNQREVCLLLPTDAGVFLLDNTDEPEDDYKLAWTTTDRSMADYSIFTNATSVCLLMVPFINNFTPDVVGRYLSLNADLPNGNPDCTVRGDLASCENVWTAQRLRLPDTLPGDDVVQQRLVALQEKLAGMHIAIELEERASEERAYEAQLLENFRQRKLGAIEERQFRRQAREDERQMRLLRMQERASAMARENRRALRRGYKQQAAERRARRRARREAGELGRDLGPSKLFVVRQRAVHALAQARGLSRAVPGAVQKLAVAGKNLIKELYVQRLERAISEEAEDRMIMDLPDPVYEVVKLARAKAFPFEEQEVKVLRGRGLTMKFCLAALRMLGKPYELPPPYVPPPRPKRPSSRRHHASKAQQAYLRRKELVHIRMRDAAEARERARRPKAVALREATPPPSSDSDDGELPPSFPALGASTMSPARLIKQERFHLPILNLNPSANT
eukprot:g1704.t1